MVYEPRTYRRTVDPADLVGFEVVVKETDLQISAQRDLTDLAEDLAVRARWQIEDFIRTHPYFAETLTPMEVPETSPELVRLMAEAGQAARVGPMAAVAGTIAEYVARGLVAESPEVIVENGGDLYLMGSTARTIALWAGADGVQGVGIHVPAEMLPIAVCTSSGKVGHSRSFGAADAVTVLARSGALADAIATALANRVREPEDIDRALEAARNMPGVTGVLVAVAGHLGVFGHVQLAALGPTGEGGSGSDSA